MVMASLNWGSDEVQGASRKGSVAHRTGSDSEGGYAVRYSKAIQQAFVLRPQHIENIWSYLDDVTDGGTSAEVKCTDDSEREFDQATPLREYENPPDKKMSKLSFRSRSLDGSIYIALTFETRGTFPVDVLVDAPDESAERIYSRLRDKLRGIIPWYGVLARQTVASMMILFLTGYIVFRFYSGLERYSDVLSLVAAIGVALFVDAARKWAFPSGYFAIGQGKQRYKTFHTLRLMAMSLIGSGLIGAIVAMLFK